MCGNFLWLEAYPLGNWFSSVFFSCTVVFNDLLVFFIEVRTWWNGWMEIECNFVSRSLPQRKWEKEVVNGLQRHAKVWFDRVISLNLKSELLLFYARAWNWINNRIQFKNRIKFLYDLLNKFYSCKNKSKSPQTNKNSKSVNEWLRISSHSK